MAKSLLGGVNVILFIVLSFLYGNANPIVSVPKIRQSIKSSNVAITYTGLHSFSSPTHRDSFIITLSGMDLLTAKVTFKILAYDKRVIYLKSFKGYNLLDDMEDVLSKRQQYAMIRKRLAHFLDVKNFAKPAIHAKENYGPDIADKADWYDVRADSNAISFAYNYGYEGTYRIAYNKRKKVAVVIFASD